MSSESVMPSSHLILCHPLLLLPSIFPSIRVFSNESALCIRWPKYWSFSFNIRPSNEHPGLISFRVDWLDLLAVQGTLKSLLQHYSSKAAILRRSAFFIIAGGLKSHKIIDTVQFHQSKRKSINFKGYATSLRYQNKEVQVTKLPPTTSMYVCVCKEHQGIAPQRVRKKITNVERMMRWLMSGGDAVQYLHAQRESKGCRITMRFGKIAGY